MDEDVSDTTSDATGAFEVTRRTVVETGATALFLTTLPRGALAAGPFDDNGPPPPQFMPPGPQPRSRRNPCTEPGVRLRSKGREQFEELTPTLQRFIARQVRKTS